jgi:hypothetical protein
VSRIERRLRNMINPYSTAFARWWCHSGRYVRLARMSTGNQAAAQSRLRRPAAPGANGVAPQGFGLHSQVSRRSGKASVTCELARQAARRAAIDAVLARMEEGDDAGQD